MHPSLQPPRHPPHFHCRRKIILSHTHSLLHLRRRRGRGLLILTRSHPLRHPHPLPPTPITLATIHEHKGPPAAAAVVVVPITTTTTRWTRRRPINKQAAMECILTLLHLRNLPHSHFPAAALQTILHNPQESKPTRTTIESQTLRLQAGIWGVAPMVHTRHLLPTVTETAMDHIPIHRHRLQIMAHTPPTTGGIRLRIRRRQDPRARTCHLPHNTITPILRQHPTCHPLFTTGIMPTPTAIMSIPIQTKARTQILIPITGTQHPMTLRTE